MPPLEIAVLTLAGPWGPYVVAATERGVVAADWAVTEEAFVAGLRRRLGPVGADAGRRRSRGPRRRDDRGSKTCSTATPVEAVAIPIDLAGRPRFDRAVLGAVQAIGWGETASYGAIARRIGAPRAARAVGGALGRNPISLAIPCHRVIAADGTIGGYGGDGWLDRDHQLARKEALLRREGVIVERRAGQERPR